MDGQVNYVLEGNINYTGAVISWLQNDLQMIASAAETERLAREAAPEDRTYFVPAFTGSVLRIGTALPQEFSAGSPGPPGKRRWCGQDLTVSHIRSLTY